MPSDSDLMDYQGTISNIYAASYHVLPGLLTGSSLAVQCNPPVDTSKLYTLECTKFQPLLNGENETKDYFLKGILFKYESI